MLRIWFAFTVVLKLIVWSLMWFGIYLAGRNFLDGEIVMGFVMLIIVVPVVLFVARVVLGISQLVVLWPISILLGRRHDFMEFSRFTLAVADTLGADRMTLRGGWKLMHLYETLPPRQPGAPARSGEELLTLLHSVWEHEQMEAAYAAFEDEGETEPPRPALG